MPDYLTGRSYTQICISLYHEDLDRLDELVEKLKKRGFKGASRSGLIRYALRFFDESSVPASAFEKHPRRRK